MRRSVVLLSVIALSTGSCSDSTGPKQVPLAIHLDTQRSDTAAVSTHFVTFPHELLITGKWVASSDCPVVLSFTGYREDGTLVVRLHVDPSGAMTPCQQQPVGYSWGADVWPLTPGRYTVQIQYPDGSGGWNTVASETVVVPWGGGGVTLD